MLFLRQRVPSAGRQVALALIMGGALGNLIDRRAERASHRLKAGDQIRVEIPAREAPTPLVPEERPLAIAYEDEWLIVVDKPAGLIVHPGAGVTSGTLVHALLHHRPAMAGV